MSKRKVLKWDYLVGYLTREIQVKAQFGFAVAKVVRLAQLQLFH